MQRRDFLKSALALGLAGLSPALYPAAGNRRHLLLIELKGGNDGLNTLVPYSDPVYHRLRPRLAIPREKVLQLTPGAGFHPALEPLMKPWQAGELAVVQGLGYPNPNRSHFRSIEIWETGSDAQEYLDSGWLARLLGNGGGRSGVVDGVALGRGGAGPLMGGGINSLVMDDPEGFLKRAARLAASSAASDNPALKHLLDVERDLKSGSVKLAQGLPRADALGEFPKHRLGRDLKNAARLFSGGNPPRVIKLSHGSFDTHANQAGRHQRLLSQLAEGVAAFRAAMKANGLWDNTLVMTYSEFGRRVKENASGGTDHGTAAPHLLLGGRVAGGLYGEAPDLNRLDKNDLRFTTDYRRLYATVAEAWFGMGAVDRRFRPIDCLKG